MYYPEESCEYQRKDEIQIPRSSRQSCSTASSSPTTDSRNIEELQSLIIDDQYENINSNNNIFHNNLDLGEPSLSDLQPLKERYKTELCRNFQMSGICNYGRKCQFAHGREELNLKPEVKSNQFYKTRPCKEFFKNLACPYGQRCKYNHNILPLSWIFKQELFFTRKLHFLSTMADQDSLKLIETALPEKQSFQFQRIFSNVHGNNSITSIENTETVNKQKQSSLWNIIQERKQLLTQKQNPKRLPFFASSFPARLLLSESTSSTNY